MYFSGQNYNEPDFFCTDYSATQNFHSLQFYKADFSYLIVCGGRILVLYILTRQNYSTLNKNEAKFRFRDRKNGLEGIYETKV